MAKDKEILRILPIGGLGEIGINCLLLEWKDGCVLIDCGVQFPDSSTPGVEQFAPDLSYIRSLTKPLLGVVVTHGHDDHIGAIPYLCRHQVVDIYCTPFPQGLITHKLEEQQLLKRARFHRIQERKKFKVGSFSFDPIPVQHSIIEALGLGIETPVGNLIHSGDFKHDPKPWHGKEVGLGPFSEWGKKGVLLLFADSTNADKAGHTLSEVDIADSFRDIFKKQKERIIVAMFASNIRRIESLLHLAAEEKKKVAFVGRSMHGYTSLAHSLKAMGIPENTLILEEDIGRHPPSQVIVFATGSQAEPQSALVRIAKGAHSHIQIRKGDLVILSSRFIPGNERAISNMINDLCRLGAEVIYESFHQVHVSGHGFQDELKALHQACQPKFFVPVHGEYRHLAKHAELAISSGIASENVFVIENGQSLDVAKDSVSLGAKFPVGRIPIVGRKLMGHDAEIFSQRMGISRAGVVFSVVARRASNLEIINRPEVASYGILLPEGRFQDQVREEAVDIVEQVYLADPENEDLEEEIRLQLRRFFKRLGCYKPIVISLIIDV